LRLTYCNGSVEQFVEAWCSCNKDISRQSRLESVAAFGELREACKVAFRLGLLVVVRSPRGRCVKHGTRSKVRKTKCWLRQVSTLVMKWVRQDILFLNCR
jgi:hypothetical protein